MYICIVTCLQNAALIALEGERHEKLSYHPAGPFRRSQLLAYKIHHNPIFYTLDLLAALALMALAIVETPTAEFHDILAVSSKLVYLHVYLLIARTSLRHQMYLFSNMALRSCEIMNSHVTSYIDSLAIYTTI